MCILPPTILETAIVIECKHSSSDDNLIDDGRRAAQQINEKRYMQSAKLKKYRAVLGYGISFYKKQCYITKVE